jgi:protein SDA1
LTTSPTLRAFIRKTILTDIKTANTPHKNHKLNRVVQSLLFGMVERGMSAEVVGDRGKKPSDQTTKGGEAMWAVSFVKELWKKGVWNDTKTVAIAARACSHPNVKVQSAGMHFFLGGEEEEDDEESEDEGPDLMKLNRQRIVKKKTKGDDRRLERAKAVASKVGKAD